MVVFGVKVKLETGEILLSPAIPQPEELIGHAPKSFGNIFALPTNLVFAGREQKRFVRVK